MLSKRVLIPSIILVLGVTVFFITDFQDRARLDDLKKEFPAITSRDTINDRVRLIYNPASFRNSGFHAFLIFSSWKKATLKVSGTLDPAQPSLNDVLAEGDSISKEAGSSEIMIIKNDPANSPRKAYKFQLAN